MIGVAADWALATPATTWLVRGVAATTAAGSAYGLGLHLQGNYEFSSEIRSKASLRELIEPTLRGGNPIRAPGILTVAAALALAATHGRNRSWPVETLSESTGNR